MSLALFIVATVAGGTPSAEAAPLDRIAPVVVRVVPATPSALTIAQRNRTEQVCRSTLVTGSLVTRRKACLTRRQWAYVDDFQQAEARRLVATSVGGVGQ